MRFDRNNLHKLGGEIGVKAAESGVKQRNRMVAFVLLIVLCTILLSGCASTGSKSPEALTKRVVHAATSLAGEELMDCFLPELSAAYRMAIQLSTSMTGENPVVYPSVKYYKEWNILNGKLILTEGTIEIGHKKRKKAKPVRDTVDIVFMMKDSLQLRFKDGVKAYYRK